MIHDEKTYASAQRHEQEGTGAIIVNHTTVFVSKRAKAKHIGCGFILLFVPN
jgi:hypothetical protein